MKYIFKKEQTEQNKNGHIYKEQIGDWQRKGRWQDMGNWYGNLRGKSFQLQSK